MARKRQYIDDIVYAEEHRNRLPELYHRIGHRLSMADRDFTEFCYYCKAPLAIIELVWDRGQNLADKGVSVTTNLARMASIRASMVAYRVDRPANVQRRIDELGREIMRLQTMFPISGFRVRMLNPMSNEFVSYDDPDAYWRWIFTMHRQHQASCHIAMRVGEIPPVNGARLNVDLCRSPLMLPVQGRLL